uniref:Zinc finger and BTB domain containing 38 n=1 Tax=Astyanax mexicanus TaxID=7994 RepID=A0A3B1JAT5_ASTMX
SPSPATHPLMVLSRLSEQRSSGLFCDVTIVVEDIKFRAHRNILAATSGYFRNAFTASETCLSSQVLELPDLKSDVFAIILNFIYSSKVETASQEDNKSLVAAGKKLGIPFLEKLLEIGKQEPEVFQNQSSALSESSSSQPKLSIPCTLKKEMPRLEDHLFCKYCQKKFMHLKRLRNHEQVCVKGPPELELNSKEALGDPDPDNTPGMENATFPIPDLQEPPTLISSVESPENELTKPSSGQRVFKCSVCKRAYVTLSSLKRHENVHSWQRAYPCHYCNKVFALAEYRTKHEIWHTGERRYQCIFCLETFMTYYILKNHQKSFHGIDPRLAVNKKSANGGFKGSVYPIKLYRLLPMKFRKKRYKSYSNPDDVISGQSLFSMPVTFMATPKMVASEMPRITFDQPSDQNLDRSSPFDKNMACTRTGGLNSANVHRKSGLLGFEGTGSPVFSYGYTASAPTQDSTGSPMLANTEKMTQNLSPGGKTETYIAKPACPGPSVNSQVLPLCQITVKIGNEAIIRRCPSLRLRAEVTTSVKDNEPFDDANDPENDKPWRPYYTYKPKRKGKKLRSKQKKMKDVQYYTRPLSPEPDDDPEPDHSPVDRIPAENSSLESRRQLRSHSPREAFACSSCSSSFSTPASLSMHIASCHQPRCKSCGKQCPSEQLPSKDGLFTENTGDCVCQSCTEDGSCFSSDVVAHSLSSEKRYRCSYCPQRFLYLATKKSHEAKHLEKSSKGRSYRYGPKVCKSAALLSMHDEKTKHFSKSAIVREPYSSDDNVSAGSYSPLSSSKSKGMPKTESWGSPEICSPPTPKSEELTLDLDLDTEGIHRKTHHIHKKTSLSFPYKSDRPFSPLLKEMHRRKAKKRSFLERSKDFKLEGHRQDSAGAETQGQKGRLPGAATSNHLSTSRIYPTCLTRVPVTKGASLQSPKSEWRLCKEEPFFHTHN